DRESRTGRCRTGADRDDSFDPARTRAFERALWIVERVEVRVRVDHAAAVGASTRGKSGAAGWMPSAWRVRPGAAFSQETSSGWPSARRISGADLGRNAESATVAMCRPS